MQYQQYQEPQNFCGRRILYPNFESTRTILPPPEQPLPVPPPGVAVRSSPCHDYYASKDINKINQNCYSCLYGEYSNTRRSSNSDLASPYNCACDLDRRFSPENFCDYAQCVEKQHKLNGSCVRPYNAIYNIDDVRDQDYMAPFTHSNLNCSVKNQSIIPFVPSIADLQRDQVMKPFAQRSYGSCNSSEGDICYR